MIKSDLNTQELLQFITLYLAAWFWHIIAINMLGAMIVALLLGNYALFFGLSIVIFVAEFIAYQRQKEFVNNLKQEGK